MRNPGNTDAILRGLRSLLSHMWRKTIELEFAFGAAGVGTCLGMARTASGMNTMLIQRARSSSWRTP